MTSQDDVAVLREMRDRGEITDEEYTALRRYVLWGTPLPPGMTGPMAPTPRGQERTGAPVDWERHQAPDLGPAAGAHRPHERPGGHATGEPFRGPARPLRRTAHRRGGPPDATGPAGPPGRGGGPVDPPRWSDWRMEPPPGDPRPVDPRRQPPPTADRAWQFPDDEGTGARRGGPPPRLPEPAGPPRPPGGRRRADRGVPDDADSRTTVTPRPEEQASPQSGRRMAARTPGTELEPARPRMPERRDAAASAPAGPGREVVRRERSTAVARPAGPVRTRSTRLALASGQPAPGRRRRQVTRVVSAVLVLALVGAGAWWFRLRSSPVQPGVYAHRVCTTVSTWQGQLAASREQLVAAISAKGAAPPTQRGALVAFYQDAEARTADLSVALSKIGPPNVAGGDEYAKALRGAVASSATSFHEEAGQAAELDTSSAAVFGPALQSRLTAIDSRARPVLDALSGQGTEPPLDLRTAFDAEPTCAAYTG